VVQNLGRHHPTIRRIRALRRDPSLRREQSVLLAEGIHLAQEALAAGAEIEFALVSPALAGREEGRRLRQEIEQRGLEYAETNDAVLDSLQDARSAQPVLMLVRRPAWPPDAGWGAGEPPPLVAAASGIQDPGNLGGLVRTADAAGATACFVAEGSADPFHPRAVRATMGSIFRLPVFAASGPELETRLRAAGLSLIGAGPRDGVDCRRCDLTRPVAIFFGAEGGGLASPLQAKMDEWVSVPMRPGVESLSVGAAAAVLLFEAARQRAGDPGQLSGL